MMRVLAVAAVLVLAGCEQSQSQSIDPNSDPTPPVQTTAVYTPDDVAAARTFLETQPPVKKWNRGVVIATWAGPDDWVGVGVFPSGRLFTIAADDDAARVVNLLVQRGDYVAYQPRFGVVYQSTIKVVQKAAVPLGTLAAAR